MLWTFANLGGRVLVAALFILAGVAKFAGPRPFLEHMAQHRVPGALLPAVAALEIGAGLMVLTGWQGRWGALALAGFCVLTAVVFHLDLANKAERTLFLKDLAIAGGLFILAAASGPATTGV